ncbi:hypothetical protein SRCM101060_02836 [Lactiplantibacillus plantarum]|uniref:hypothetical protein n=1 Tax=Lactiplantibacillus plantarum TaxID=1590 RepID=UPI0007E9736B|nr:hypothetical protein [Lactiplantibacillus plantarum]OAZ73389.1 hypothetical protein SRCM101060_02836 [Lactiplantibacillus plantarum]
MIIKQLKVDNKTFTFSEISSLIYSSKNSSGKTSLVRLILYSLGYPIPSTKGFDFSKLDLEIKIIVDNKPITIDRQNILIKIHESKKNELVFKLPEEQNEVTAIITNISNPKVSENILGLSYFDQDKGWSLLNRGIVIGKYRFNIEQLIDGLSNSDIEMIQDDLSKEKAKRKLYFQIKQLIALQEERNKNIQSIDWSSVDNLQENLRSVNMKFNQKREQIKNFEVIAKDNKKFEELLEKMNITVKIGRQQAILTTKNIVDYEFNRSVVIAQISRLKSEFQKINSEKNQLERELNQQLQLIDSDDQIERFSQQISKIKISSKSLDSKLNQNNTEIKRLNKIIERNLKHTHQVQDVYTTLKRFASILGVDDCLASGSNFIFTSNLKIYSGAKLHLLVFGFRLALLKIVQEQFGEKYPIIIDSPKSGELDTKNVNKMFKLLDKEFPKNQVIVASIYDYARKWHKKIVLNKGVMY